MRTSLKVKKISIEDMKKRPEGDGIKHAWMDKVNLYAQKKQIQFYISNGDPLDIGTHIYCSHYSSISGALYFEAWHAPARIYRHPNSFCTVAIDAEGYVHIYGKGKNCDHPLAIKEDNTKASFAEYGELGIMVSSDFNTPAH